MPAHSGVESRGEENGLFANLAKSHVIFFSSEHARRQGARPPKNALLERRIQEYGPAQAFLAFARKPPGSHKFQIGETVYVGPAIRRHVPGGVYEVTKQLPHNGREFEYRIKSANEEHERVARESELTKA